MDGVRIAAGWVRELQGRWLGLHWGRLEVRRTVFSRRIGPLWPSAGAAMRGMAREYAAGNSRGPGWREFAGKLGQLQAGQSGGEWNGSQSGHGASELGFPRPMLGKMQGKAARRAGDPSHQSEEPPPEGFGGRDPVHPGPMRAVQRARLCAITCTASQAPLAAKRPDGMWFRPTPYLRSRMAFSISAWRRWSASSSRVSPSRSVMKP